MVQKMRKSSKSRSWGFESTSETFLLWKAVVFKTPGSSALDQNRLLREPQLAPGQGDSLAIPPCGSRESSSGQAAFLMMMCYLTRSY